jgi:hypothetical protein
MSTDPSTFQLIPSPTTVAASAGVGTIAGAGLAALLGLELLPIIGLAAAGAAIGGLADGGAQSVNSVGSAIGQSTGDTLSSIENSVTNPTANIGSSLITYGAIGLLGYAAYTYFKSSKPGTSKRRRARRS